MTIFARHQHIGQKVHLYGAVSVAFAGLAAAARNVEAEATRLVAANLRLGQSHKELADVGEDAGVSGRIRARSAAYGRLVHRYHLVNILKPLNGRVGQRFLQAVIEVAGDDGSQRAIDERRLA